VDSVEGLIKIADGLKAVRQRRWRRPRHVYFTLEEQLDAIEELGRSGSVAAWRYIQRLAVTSHHSAAYASARDRSAGSRSSVHPYARGPLSKALYSRTTYEVWTDGVGDRYERNEAAEHEHATQVVQTALRELTRALYEDEQRATCARLEVEFRPSDVFDDVRACRGILAGGTLQAVRAPDLTAGFSNWVCVHYPTFDLADFNKFNGPYAEGVGIRLHHILAAHARLAPYLGLPPGPHVVLDEHQDRVVLDAQLAREWPDGRGNAFATAEAIWKASG
jgi:hypothetical protein